MWGARPQVRWCWWGKHLLRWTTPWCSALPSSATPPPGQRPWPLWTAHGPRPRCWWRLPPPGARSCAAMPMWRRPSWRARGGPGRRCSCWTFGRAESWTRRSCSRSPGGAPRTQVTASATPTALLNANAGVLVEGTQGSTPTACCGAGALAESAAPDAEAIPVAWRDSAHTGALAFAVESTASPSDDFIAPARRVALAGCRATATGLATELPAALGWKLSDAAAPSTSPLPTPRSRRSPNRPGSARPWAGSSVAPWRSPQARWAPTPPTSPRCRAR
jgi:hypothetical protein